MLTSGIRLSFAVRRPRWFDREELEVHKLGFKLSIRVSSSSCFVRRLRDKERWAHCTLTARKFSLKNDGRCTVAFTKYRISALPGKPLSDGGSVLFTCLSVFLAISTRMPIMLRFVSMELVLAQSLLNGICK